MRLSIGLKTGLFFFFSFFISFYAAAGGHPKIELLDEQGNNVILAAKQGGARILLNSAAYLEGKPYSPRQTCGACHDYKAITNAYHFQIGAKEVADNWGKRHKESNYLKSPGQFGGW